MAATASSDFTRWQIQPDATRLLTDRLSELCRRSPTLALLGERLLIQTGTRLFDWIDTIHVPAGPELEQAGFTDLDPYQVTGRWHHPGAQLPWVMADGRFEVVLRVESVVDFLRAQTILQRPHSTATAGPTYGIREPLAMLGDDGATRRSALFSEDGDVVVRVLERHGDQRSANVLQSPTVCDPRLLRLHLERMRLRPRQFENGVDGIRRTIDWVGPVVDDLGTDVACDLFFQAEREYWQLRNDAAELQYRAQSQLGFGWANHDHHTDRSSRQCFAPLVELLELLGMFCRERFYAGADAAWGAQVLEQPAAQIVVFADVDMSADEVLGDFAHDGLGDGPNAPAGRGTVGLWCHLHGEAVLQAGMHHLECQFDFENARQRLAKLGTDSLNPFTDFEFLRQSFTRGQVWPVLENRIQSALAMGWINAEQADRFRKSGVTGSHLEILERNDGYKGFNQTGISDIIARTDPRNAEMS